MHSQFPRQNTQNAELPRESRSHAAFRGHLTTFLLVGAFLFTLNVLTSFGEWWFYWPLFFWGWALITHAVVTFGLPGLDRWSSIGSTLFSRSPAAAGATSRPASFAAAAFAELHERIEHLRATAGTLPDGTVQTQVESIVSRATAIASVLAEDRASANMVRSFSDGFLQPTEEILTHYARLNDRNIPGAADALRGVEEESLPQIQRSLDQLYEQLHHRDVVQLSVANDLADFDLSQAQRAISTELDKLRV